MIVPRSTADSTGTQPKLEGFFGTGYQSFAVKMLVRPKLKGHQDLLRLDTLLAETLVVEAGERAGEAGIGKEGLHGLVVNQCQDHTSQNKDERCKKGFDPQR